MYLISTRVKESEVKKNYQTDESRFGNTALRDTTISRNMGYVANGLVLHYDGIQNTLGGHSDSTNVWKELTKTDLDGVLMNGCTWNNDCNIRC